MLEPYGRQRIGRIAAISMQLLKRYSGATFVDRISKVIDHPQFAILRGKPAGKLNRDCPPRLGAGADKQALALCA